MARRYLFAIPQPSDTPLGQVTGLNGDQATSTSVALTWTGVSGATNYVVQYRVNGTSTWSTFSHSASATPAITVTGLSSGTAYDFRVAALNSFGQGAYSSVATVGSVTPATTQIGIDISLNGLNSTNNCGTEFTRVVNAMGLQSTPNALGSHAKFYGQDLSEAISHYGDAAGAGYTGIPVLCHNTPHAASVYNARMSSISSPEVWVWRQEFEPTAPADVDAQYQVMDNARQAHVNGHLISLCVNAGNSQEAQNRQWDQLHPWNYHLDYPGMDTYCGDFKTAAQSQFSNLFAESIAWKASIDNRPGGPWAGYKGFVCPEFGVAKQENNVVMAQAARRDKITGLFDQLIANGWAWVNYWDENNDDVNSDWTIDDQPTVLAGCLPYITRP